MYVIDIPFFDLEQTYKSGQCLRWKKLCDYMYIVPHGNIAVRLQQQDERFIIGCDDAAFYDLWFHYFDLKTDYQNVNISLKMIDDPHIKICANRSKGVRIMWQDLFETIIASLIVGDYGVIDAREKIEAISTTFGKQHSIKIPNIGSFKWHEFPSSMEFLENQDELKSCGITGLCREAIIDICQAIGNGLFDLQALHRLGYEESYEKAVDYLMLNGMTESESSRICLFGLRMHQAFPMDNIVTKIISSHADCEAHLFHRVLEEWYGDSYSSHAGILYQYLLYNEINPPKEKEVWV